MIKLGIKLLLARLFKILCDCKGITSSVIEKAYFKEEIDSWIKNASEDQVMKLSKGINFFLFYYEPLEKIKDDSVYTKQYSNFILILLFSLIEGMMEEKEYKNCVEYLKIEEKKYKNCIRIINIKKLFGEMIEEYEENYGIVKSVKKFFEKYVRDKDKEFILTVYKDGKKETINAIINDIYDMRSDFIHSCGFEALSRDDVELEFKKDDKMGEYMGTIVSTLNLRDFIVIVWYGILNKYRFDKKFLNQLLD